ncbi:hypothetical protein ACFSKW_54590 [Nonomuraea mangrovi]|uniref:Uncharacterized protein n=1 Tax=Nonomuraea mangrovi TaxID=2316207 RepID=A0ABW4THG2_9ACTN
MALGTPDGNYAGLDREIAELSQRLDLLDDARQTDEDVAELMQIASGIKVLWDALDEHVRRGDLPRVWRERVPRPPIAWPRQIGPIPGTPKTPRS